MKWILEHNYTRTPILDLDEQIDAAVDCLNRARIAADPSTQRHYLTAARLRIDAVIAQYPEAPTPPKGGAMKSNDQGFTGPYDPANAGKIKYNAATKQRVLQIERDLRELMTYGSDRVVSILESKLEHLYLVDVLAEMGRRGWEREDWKKLAEEEGDE